MIYNLLLLAILQALLLTGSSVLFATTALVNRPGQRDIFAQSQLSNIGNFVTIFNHFVHAYPAGARASSVRANKVVR